MIAQDWGILPGTGSADVLFLFAPGGSVTVPVFGKSFLVSGTRVLAVFPGSAAGKVMGGTCERIGIRLAPTRPGVISVGALLRAAGSGQKLPENRAVPFTDSSGLMQRTQTLLASFKEYPAPEREMLSSHALSVLLTEVLRAETRSDRELPAMNTHLRDAVRYLRENYMLDIGAQDAADAAGIHISYLHKLFDEELHTHPGDYLLSVRLEKAKYLLSRTGLPLATIAELCGFASAQYFSRRFRLETGQTPSGYRRSAAFLMDSAAPGSGDEP